MKAFSAEKALEIISGKSGDQLDPTLCAIFADVVGVDTAASAQRDAEDDEATEYSPVQAGPE